MNDDLSTLLKNIQVLCNISILLYIGLNCKVTYSCRFLTMIYEQ